MWKIRNILRQQEKAIKDISTQPYTSVQRGDYQSKSYRYRQLAHEEAARIVLQYTGKSEFQIDIRHEPWNKRYVVYELWTWVDSRHVVGILAVINYYQSDPEGGGQDVGKP